MSVWETKGAQHNHVGIRRVLGILAGLVTCFTLFTFIVAQIVAPTLRNLVLDLKKQTEGTH